MEHVEKLRPHSISGPGPEDGAAASQAQFLPTLISVWSEQLRRQWADTPQHSGSGSKKLPASETEEQLGASYRPFQKKWKSMTALSLDVSEEECVGLGSLRDSGSCVSP